MVRNSTVLAFATALAFPGSVWAQEYPTKPITVIVAFAAGGVSDLSVRILADHMSRTLGQPVVIENRGGAGGRTGTEMSARAAPDGYTLVLGNAGTHGVVPAAYKSIGYDPVEDFTFIAQYGAYPFTLICNNDLAVANFDELAARIRSEPEAVTFSNPGAGGQGHMLAALLETRLDAKVLHVAYQGAGPAKQDVISGVADCTIDGAARAQVVSGEVRAFAVASATRDPAIPDIPTFGEVGVENFELPGWLSLMGPSGMDQKQVEKLAEAVEAAVSDPGVVQALDGIGVIAGYAGPEELKELVVEDLATYRQVAQDAGIALE